MNLLFRLSFALVITLATGASQAQSTDALNGLKASVYGPPTKVMVLGTAHLAQLPPGFNADMLAPVLDRLTVYAPTLIATEALSGETCNVLVSFKATYDGVADDYCKNQFAVESMASKTTGLDVAAATAQANALLATWPKDPTPTQRRHLAAVFAASGDFGSALVQWLRLPAADQREGDGLGADLVVKLNDLKDNSNEVSQIAAVMAARLGLERIYPCDDHTADSIQGLAGDGFGEAIQALWAKPDPYSAAYRARVTQLTSPANVLALYQFLNAPQNQQAVLNGEWKGALSQSTPQLFGRQYVAWWETRNLRIAANVRTAFGNHPGARVLLIIGASHKPYLDAYLSMMHEVETVDAALVLQ